jgi:hypothetical protein
MSGCAVELTIKSVFIPGIKDVVALVLLSIFVCCFGKADQPRTGVPKNLSPLGAGGECSRKGIVVII